MNETRPDLNLLVVFDAVASCRSVSEAARRLSLSQPAVSHALNRLRDLLGDRLFVRGRTGFLPTPRAEAMIEPVRELLAAAGVVLASRSFDPSTSETNFRIVASDYANTILVPRLAARCRALAPGVGLTVASVGMTTLSDLETGDLDCAFWGAAVPEAPWCSRSLFGERLVGAMGRAHPLAARAAAGRITLDDYLAHPHVVVSLRDPSPSIVDTTLASLGLSRRVAVRTTSFASNLATLAGTDLIASVPSRLAAAMDPDAVIVFEVPLDLPPIDYRLVWHRRTDTDPGAAWLRRTIFDCVADLAGDRPPP